MSSLAEFSTVGLPTLALSSNGWGRVFVAREKASGRLVVIKQRRFSELGKKRDRAHEAHVYERLGEHAHVLRCLGHFYEDESASRSLCLILEYCPRGDLSGEIERRREAGQWFEEAEVWALLGQLCSALAFVHEQRLIHRDVKSKNIFLRDDGSVCLGDFGVSRVVQHEREMARTVFGTPYFMSPELWAGLPYTMATDVWSLGVVLYEVCALRVPFGGGNLVEVQRNTTQGKYEELPERYSATLRQAVRKLLRVDHTARPTVREFVEWWGLKSEESRMWAAGSDTEGEEEEEEVGVLEDDEVGVLEDDEVGNAVKEEEGEEGEEEQQQQQQQQQQPPQPQAELSLEDELRKKRLLAKAKRIRDVLDWNPNHAQLLDKVERELAGIGVVLETLSRRGSEKEEVHVDEPDEQVGGTLVDELQRQQNEERWVEPEVARTVPKRYNVILGKFVS